jgi:hypothetical protein
MGEAIEYLTNFDYEKKDFQTIMMNDIVLVILANPVILIPKCVVSYLFIVHIDFVKIKINEIRNNSTPAISCFTMPKTVFILRPNFG